MPAGGRGGVPSAGRMRRELDGIHHVTCITGDAPANVEFYAGTLGLRLVKKTVNQDDPTVYHLFYADERGSAGSDITFFEYPGAPRGRAGDGMVHRIVFRVASEEALDFWAERAGGERNFGSVLIHDPEGLALELVVDDSGDEPLIADHPEIPRELALRGFAGVRAYSSDYGRERDVPLGARLHAGLGGPRREARRLLRLRRRARGARHVRRRHGPPRGLVVEARGARGVAREGARRRRAADAGDRPLLLPLDLLPRAERRAVRDRDARAGVHRRRAARDARRAPLAAARLRAAAGRAREAPDPAARSAAGAARDLRRPAGGRLRRGRRSSSSTAAARASTTCSACSTRSTRPSGSTASARAARSRCRRAAPTGTRCRASATPTRRPSPRASRRCPGSSTRCRTTRSCSAASRRAP